MIAAYATAALGFSGALCMAMGALEIISDRLEKILWAEETDETPDGKKERSPIRIVGKSGSETLEAV